MTSYPSVWAFICGKMDLGIRVNLLFVLESEGSSPGRKGFAMGVGQDGSLFGSIGGGIMEHKLVELARSRFSTPQPSAQTIPQIHHKEVRLNQSGMICSGRQLVWLYEITQEDLPALQSIAGSLEKKEPIYLQIYPDRLSASFESKGEKGQFNEDRTAFSGMLEYRLGHHTRVHLVGGGHCALALSELLVRLDFEVWVFEDRPQLNTLEMNHFARKKILIPDYRELGSFLPEHPEDMVVLMSFGYRTDDLALRALQHRNYAFLGVLGSQNKIAEMWQQYQSEGWDAAWLSRIHAPVGIPIKSQTPHEIAVSIAAQLIAVRNQDYK